MVGLKIELFGDFRVQRGEDLIEQREWNGQKSRSLLKLLLTRPGRAFSKDEIVEALWPDSSPEAATRRLRITISQLRRVLEPDLSRGSDSRYVLRQRPGYLFERASDCEVDAWKFEERQNSAEKAREGGELDKAIEKYRAALELWRGVFLGEDPYEEWAISARDEWQARRLSAFSGLAECLAHRGRYTEAIEVCKEALALETCREDLHCRLMLYHYCAGEQALALRTYRDYAQRLQEDLGTGPSPEMKRLKTQIEQRDVPGVDEKRHYPKPRRPLRFPYSLSRTHFVGREREYALLAERLREVTEGSGGAIAVEGEAGVGKTRLVEEFLGYARNRGARVLSGRCYERDLGPPLEPVMDVLDPAAEKMVAGTLRHGVENLDRGANSYDGARVYRVLTRELLRQSRETGALILFVDDIQWADPATLGFLSYWASRIPRESALLMVTYRREDTSELAGWLDHLAERRSLTTLRLDRLSLEDTEDLLGRMSSQTFDELSSLASIVHRESEGNPFYAVEYLRWLIETGAVEVNSQRRISALRNEFLRENVLPSGVRSLLQARLSGMNAEARNLLELAAVMGRDFDPDLLRIAADRGSAGIFKLLEPLATSGLVVKDSAGTCHLSHDKLRQALYEGIEDFRRPGLHLRVARALEAASGDPAELAHHYLRAGAWRSALENLVLAARKAEEGYAWEIALKNYARALEIVDELPDSRAERLELLSSREHLLEHMDRRQERSATVQEMFELAKHLGDPSRIAEAHVRRIGVFASLSDSASLMEAERAAVEAFREMGDRAGEARAYREIGYVRWRNRDYARALEANLNALWLHRGLEDRRGEAGDAGNIAKLYRSMGDHEQALYWAEEAVRIHRDLDDKLGEAMSMDAIAAIHRERGDPASALPLVLETLRLYSELGVKHCSVARRSTCGTLYLHLGAPEEALHHFRAAAACSREMGYARDEGHSLTSAGIALEQLGDYSGAADAYRRSATLLGTAYKESGMVRDLSGQADALTLLARTFHHSLEQPLEAIATYETAAGAYRVLEDPQRLRKVLLALAGLRWRTGDLEGSTLGYEETLRLAREHNEKAPEAAALASLSVTYRELGRLKESVRHARAALDVLRDLDDPQAEAYVLSSLAESYGRLEHYPSALSCLKRSLRLRKSTGDREGEVEVLLDLARTYEALGDHSSACACTETVASIKAEGSEYDQVPGIPDHREYL